MSELSEWQSAIGVAGEQLHLLQSANCPLNQKATHGFLLPIRSTDQGASIKEHVDLHLQHLHFTLTLKRSERLET